MAQDEQRNIMEEQGNKKASSVEGNASQLSLTGFFLTVYFCGRARTTRGYDLSRLSGSKNEGAIS
ncbi:MAG: hypothetical protein KA748_17305, partial [Halomonas sp.]